MVSFQEGPGAEWTIARLFHSCQSRWADHILFSLDMTLHFCPYSIVCPTPSAQQMKERKDGIKGGFYCMITCAHCCMFFVVIHSLVTLLFYCPLGVLCLEARAPSSFFSETNSSLLILILSALNESMGMFCTIVYLPSAQTTGYE